MIEKKKNIIVVTGGAGFVGSNLISLLIKKTSFKSVLINLKFKLIFYPRNFLVHVQNKDKNLN